VISARLATRAASRTCSAGRRWPWRSRPRALRISGAASRGSSVSLGDGRADERARGLGRRDARTGEELGALCEVAARLGRGVCLCSVLISVAIIYSVSH
jgi:hypothetical protein